MKLGVLEGMGKMGDEVYTRTKHLWIKIPFVT